VPILVEPTLKVIGSYFLPEVRTLCLLLDINGVTYTFKETTDVFSTEGQTEYSKLNPAGQMPTLIDKGMTIIADPSTILRYVCKTQRIRDSHYPQQ
jgi:glutathione S-transferase